MFQHRRGIFLPAILLGAHCKVKRVNATDLNRIRLEASSPFWWTKFWLFRRYALALCREVENARNAEPLPLPRDLLMEIANLKAAKLKATTSVAKLIQFIHVHTGMGRMKPTPPPQP